MKGRLFFLAIAAVAIVAAATYSLRGNDNGATKGATTPTTTPKPPSGALHILLAFSPDKDAMILDLVARYNAERREIDGRPVFVDTQKIASGDAETKIAKGSFQPVAWTPASSLWGRLLNVEADHPYVPRDNPSIVRTPLVFAIWEPEARALGWPRKPIGFADILALATSKASWAKFGLPTYGTFKLGHTNPDFSTSGLSFVSAQYYTAAHKLEGLTIADVRRPAVRAFVRRIESSIVHYGDTTLFFADQLKAHGPGYASVVAMEESTLLDINKTRPAGLPRLVAIYPKEGTFLSDHPFIVLDAPWVTPELKRAASDFGAWVEKEVTPQIAAQYGFRPGDPRTKPLAPVTAANGVDPQQPARVLGLPEPRVLAAIRRAWHADRKPANVMLVVDVSGSMGDEHKLESAKRGLDVFLKQLSPRDRVGLTIFNDRIETIVPIAPFKTNAGVLRSAVANLVADGDTALYDAAEEGYDAVAKLSDESRINAVVLLSDGEDTASGSRLEDVLRTLKGRSSDRAAIRIFTIAYGSDARQDVLSDIAGASEGKPYVGDPNEIESVYLQISSFF